MQRQKSRSDAPLRQRCKERLVKMQPRCRCRHCPQLLPVNRLIARLIGQFVCSVNVRGQRDVAEALQQLDQRLIPSKPQMEELIFAPQHSCLKGLRRRRRCSGTALSDLGTRRYGSLNLQQCANWRGFTGPHLRQRLAVR